MLPRNVLAIRKTIGAATEIITSWTQKSSNATLLDFPPGSYTGMRTIDKLGILDFTGHTNRLANSLQHIQFLNGAVGVLNDKSAEEELAAFKRPEIMKKETADLVRAGLKLYYSQLKGDLNNEKLLAKMYKDSNEALLLDQATQNLYEGLSSNFFAYHHKRQTLLSAPLNSVLQGTVLRMVLSVCKEENIPVDFTFPNLKQMDEWEGAFLSSTSRLILPIEKLVLPDGSVKEFGESPTIELIRNKVRKECEKRVENLLTPQDLK
ncbi:hypothetical protein BG011_009415 [Mortierella polycephala]|uniref:Uncharacterized protein n=1 Tax=Mortierella polycephala TaxID=41804 RepID=A0A9P6QCP1_9FUNG|nr:hypothetical protein BG011_009415 [Mortierella polycephala]